MPQLSDNITIQDDGDQLVRLTVSLVPPAIDALDHAAKTTGDTKTDTVNLALIVFDHLTNVIKRGGGQLRLSEIMGALDARIVVMVSGDVREYDFREAKGILPFDPEPPEVRVRRARGHSD